MKDEGAREVLTFVALVTAMLFIWACWTEYGGTNYDEQQNDQIHALQTVVAKETP